MGWMPLLLPDKYSRGKYMKALLLSAPLFARNLPYIGTIMDTVNNCKVFGVHMQNT